MKIEKPEGFVAELPERLQGIDFKEYKDKAMVYQKEAMDCLSKTLKDAGFRLLGSWKKREDEDRETLIFDYIIPSGHIEFCVKISGWGHAVGCDDKEAGA